VGGGGGGEVLSFLPLERKKMRGGGKLVSSLPVPGWLKERTTKRGNPGGGRGKEGVAITSSLDKGKKREGRLSM